MPGTRHLQIGVPPTNAMTVSWHSATPLVSPRVQTRTGVGITASTPATTTAVPGGGFYHHARLTGLPPGATVRYRPCDGPRPLREWAQLRTAPHDPAAPVRFTVAGDQGTTPAARRVVDAVLRHRPALHLHPGDLAYANHPGSPSGVVDQTAWERWFDLIEPAAAVIPWMPAMGNHDADAITIDDGDPTVSFRSRFALPAGAPISPAYSWVWGCVGFVALDSNDVNHEFPGWAGHSGGAQTRWLATRLAALRANPRVRVIVVFLHHGVYASNPAHGSDGGVRDAWAPLFDRFAVDLVCSGHNHGSERTYPIRDGCAVAPGEGTVYLTAGAGGQGRRGAVVTPQRGRARLWTAPGQMGEEPDHWSVWRDGDNALSVVDVEPDDSAGAAITVATVDLDDTVIDRVGWSTARCDGRARGVA